MTVHTPSDNTSATVAGEVDDDGAELVDAETLVEEVSIDGMCGVY
ncbi:mycofactocin precursor MftA [uncultured Jatrophihabitans sp.]